jgi:predicted nuclease of predicted toxin-antitoxin system
VLGRILLDADVPPAIAARLIQLEHDAVAASGDPALEALEDVELLRDATRQARVLVSFNIADFVEAARRFAHEQETHAGIILVHSKSYRRTNIGAIADALDRMMRSREDFENSVLFLE